MGLPILSLFDVSIDNYTIGALLDTNKKSKDYGLWLFPDGAREILEARDEILKAYGRVELSSDVTCKVINEFCSSPFINQDEYISTINALHEIFYAVKNLIANELADSKLIEMMCELFNGPCHGSVELLVERLTGGDEHGR